VGRPHNRVDGLCVKGAWKHWVGARVAHFPSNRRGALVLTRCETNGWPTRVRLDSVLHGEGGCSLPLFGPSYHEAGLELLAATIRFRHETVARDRQPARRWGVITPGQRFVTRPSGSSGC
jgi:hypothetical protein